MTNDSNNSRNISGNNSKIKVKLEMGNGLILSSKISASDKKGNRWQRNNNDSRIYIVLR